MYDTCRGIAKERAFLQRARDLYALALQDAPVTSAQRMEDLSRRYRNKEITEEEYDAAFDRAYSAEDALRADVQNSFAGENARTADLEQLRAAKEMLAEDVAPETIRQQTGWFQGADGKWRFEISDENMQYQRRGDLNFRRDNPGYNRYRELVDKAENYMLGKSDAWLSEAEINEMNELREEWGEYFKQDGKPRENAMPRSRLSDYIQHDELFAAYPWLKDSVLIWDNLQEGTKGKYNPGSNTITLDNSLRHAPEGDILHEVQHMIQEEEGFSGGSSVEYWMKQGDSREESYQNYRNTAGEIEARDTANRMNMTAEERKNTPPDTGDENKVFADSDAVQYFAADSATENEEVLHLKDQARKHLDELNAMAPVANVKSPTTFPSRVSERRKWVMSILTSTEAVRQDVGVIRVDSKQIGTALSYIKDPSGLAAFTTLMRVLNRGKLIETHHDHKNNGIVTYTFGAPVTINGTTGIMVATVKRTKGNNYRAHAILMPDGSAFILPDASKNEADPHSVLAQSETERLDEPTVSASNNNVSESEPSVNTNPLPKANSSTLQNSFSEPAETGVPLPSQQTEQKAPDGVPLPKAGTATQTERLPKKAQTYLNRAKRSAVEKIARALDLPAAAKREFMNEHLQEVTEEYLKTGKISEETRDKIFEQAYSEGRVIVDDFYKENKHIKDEIRKCCAGRRGRRPLRRAQEASTPALQN